MEVLVPQKEVVVPWPLVAKALNQVTVNVHPGARPRLHGNMRTRLSAGQVLGAQARLHEERVDVVVHGLHQLAARRLPGEPELREEVLHRGLVLRSSLPLLNYVSRIPTDCVPTIPNSS